MSVAEYLGLVGGRTSPGDRGERRVDEILSISVSTSPTAHLRIREVFLPKLFTDELNLVKFDGT